MLLGSLGIYVFSWQVLRRYLTEDEANPNSDNDFGKNIIPNMLNDGMRMAAYRFEGYWKDVGTLESLWDANMDMLSVDSGLDVADESWPVYARSLSAPPCFLGRNAVVKHSAFNRGSYIDGTVENSVLSPDVTVGEGAKVSYSVVLPGVTIEPGAVVEYAILGEGCHVGKNCRIGAAPEEEGTDVWGGLTVIAPHCELTDERVVPAGKMLAKNGEEVSK